MGIKVGVCGDISSIKIAEKAGYAYLECAFQNFAKMSEEEFEKALKHLEGANIRVEACNGYFSSDIALIGDKVDFKFIEEYSRRGMERVSKLGCKVVVIGSGGARRIPEGVPFEEGFNQFARVVAFCADIAKEYDIQIVVEPLNRNETNLINTVTDGLELCKRLNHKNVKALADFYHVFRNGENLDAVINSNGLLAHTHLARDNEDRRTPRAENKETCEKIADALKKIGYNGRISLECVFEADYEADITAAREIMKVFED